MSPVPGSMDGNSPQQQVPHRPTTSHLPGPFPFSTTASSYMDSFRSGGNGDLLHSGSTPVYSRSPTTPSYQYNPLVQLQNQRDGTDCREGPFNGIDPRSRSVAGHNQGLTDTAMLQEAGREHPCDYILDHWRRVDEQSALGSLGPIFTLQGSFNGSADSHGALLPFHNHTSATPGGEKHESQLQVVNEFAVQFSRPLHPNDPGLGPYSTTNITTFMPEGLLRQAERDRRDPYANARSYRAQQHLDRISTSSGSSAGTTDIPKYTEPSYHYSHREEVMGDGRYLAAVPPSLHSDGIPNQPSGAQRSRKRRKTERTTGQNEAVPGRKRTLKEKSCDLSHSAKPSPASSVVTSGPTCRIKVPQTWYKAPARQDDWERVEPIEFWAIKLTDAANLTWAGTHGYGDKVLNYEGVGSSILCRINFPEREVGKSRILTTNNKTPREAITKAKLALEVAKLVRRCIEDIKDESGCADITFENLVLVRLVRVSKATWQPVLLYEVPAPRAGPS